MVRFKRLVSGSFLVLFSAAFLNPVILFAATPLTVTGITVNSKVYDGNRTATLDTSGATLVGVIPGDSVSLDTGSYTATFDTATSTTGKLVTVTGLALSGAQAASYTLTQPTGLTGTVTKKSLTVSGLSASNKTYDGTTSATISGTASLSGVISPDSVSVSGTAVGTFASKDVGTGKTVTISGLTLTGTDAINYSLTTPTTTANITASAGVTNIQTSTNLSSATTSVMLASSDTSSYSVSIASSASNPSLDLSLVLSGQTATMPGSVSVTASSLGCGGVGVDIGSGVSVTASGSWGGVIALPAATTTYATSSPPSGSTDTFLYGIGLGTGGSTSLTTGSQVKITLTGCAGNHVGISQNGVFRRMTYACSSASSPTSFDSNGECVATSGNDLILWTRSLASLVIFSESSRTSSDSTGGNNGAPGGGLDLGPVYLSGSGGSSNGVLLGSIVPGAIHQALSQTKNQNVSVSPAPLASVSVPVVQAPVFVSNLFFGQTGDSVAQLQRFLTEKGLLPEVTGRAVGIFGSRTQAALQAYQRLQGITPTGTLGPITRNAVNRDMSGSGAALVSTTVVNPTSEAGSALLNENIGFGLSGSVVMRLQKFLNTHGYPIAESGPGSAGNEVERFGAKTREMLSKFQADNGISPANGYLGSRTRALINGRL